MKVLRKGGKFTQSRIDRFANQTILWWASSGVVVILLATLLNRYLALVAGALAFLYGMSICGLWQQWWKGKAGETAVIKALESLSDDYLLINDIVLPGRGGNIDHFLAGPNGLFALETKNWSGKIKSYGDEWFQNGRKRKSLSKQSKSNAVAVHNVLPGRHLYVVPVLVFVNPEASLEAHHPTIPIVRIEALAEFIGNYQRSALLSKDQIKETIYHLLSCHAASSLTRVEGRIVESNT